MVCAPGPDSPSGDRGDFAAELDAAITRRGRSLGWLHRRLADGGTPVSLSTLSYWRSGHRRPEHAPSRAAVVALEELLLLPPQYLSARLGPARRTGPPVPSQPLSEVSPPGAEQLIHDAMGFSEEQLVSLAEVSTHVVVELDPEGRPVRVTNRILWRSMAEGAQSTCQLFWADGQADLEPVFSSVSGCTMSAPTLAPEHHLAGVELRLQRPLELGDTAITEYTVELPSTAEAADSYETFVRRRSQEVLIWVRFHRARVPAAAVAFAKTAWEQTEIRHTDLAGLTAVHHRFTNAMPGSVGLRWTW